MYEEKLLKVEEFCKESNSIDSMIPSLGLIEIIYDSKDSTKNEINICDRIKKLVLPLFEQKLVRDNKYDLYKNKNKRDMYNSLIEMIFKHEKEQLEYDLGFFTGIYYLFKEDMSDDDYEAFKDFKGIVNTRLNGYKDIDN